MYKHILVPYDGSERSNKAVSEATSLAKALGANITLLHVLAPFRAVMPLSLDSGALRAIESQHDAERQAEAEKALAATGAPVTSAGVKCETVVVVGDSPYRTIIDQAQARRCDLILMASHGRSGLEGLLLGSETVKVLTHSTMPVLVVR